MRVKECEKCKHYERHVWTEYYKPPNYHAIGMNHAFAFCIKHERRCLQVTGCRGPQFDAPIESEE